VAPRKSRIRTVIDTNVWVSFLIGGSKPSAVGELVHLWRDLRRLQLIVSEGVIAEYVRVLERLGLDDALISRFVESLRTRDTVTHVNLGPRMVMSRDPDDNLMLSTAHAGRASFLITGDRDLLDLPKEQCQRLRFEIVRPAEFLPRV
jgi:putative PIN family toxin of toxin-antitoxin system